MRQALLLGPAVGALTQLRALHRAARHELAAARALLARRSPPPRAAGRAADADADAADAADADASAAADAADAADAAVVAVRGLRVRRPLVFGAAGADGDHMRALELIQDPEKLQTHPEILRLYGSG